MLGVHPGELGSIPSWNKILCFLFLTARDLVRLVKNWILTRETGVRISIMSAGKNLTETHDLSRSQYTDSNTNP